MSLLGYISDDILLIDKKITTATNTDNCYENQRLLLY
jgi:hypothetical protein